MNKSENASVKTLDSKAANMTVAGIDVGAVTTKVVVLRNGKPITAQTRTTPIQASISKSVEAALAAAGLKVENIDYIVSTGCGRTQVPFANERITEISCAAAGSVRIWGKNVGTVLDAGGHYCKVLHCNEAGKATDFLWNDKCAAGIGRSLESFAALLNKDVDKAANLAVSDSTQAPKISDFCLIYAQSEALDLVRSNVPLEQIIIAYHYAMASRISRLVNRLGIKKDLAMVGGVSKNAGVIYWLSRILNTPILPPKPEWDPVLACALGAALFAEAACNKGSKSK